MGFVIIPLILVVLVKSPSPVLILFFFGSEKEFGKKARRKLNIHGKYGNTFYDIFFLISDCLILKTV
jgi:hypothetical protein